MYRRVVALVLLPCVLLTQSAALSHCHGEGQAAGHGQRRHFHVAPVAAGSNHHGHGCCGHHHHGPAGHHHHHDDDAADGPAPAPTPSSTPLSDHDADAVFIDAVDLIAGERPGPFVEPAAPDALPAGVPAFPSAREDLHGAPLRRTHSPPAPSCPLYVCLCALLI